MKKNIIGIVLLCLTIWSCSSDGSEGGTSDIIFTPLVGVGSITFDDTGNGIIGEFGPYDDLSVSHMGSTTAFWLIYDEEGLEFQLDDILTGGISLSEALAQASSLIDLQQKIRQMTLVPPFKGESKEGIKLGSDRSEVVEVFGEPDITGSIEVYQDLAMRMWYNSADKVNRIDILTR